MLKNERWQGWKKNSRWKPYKRPDISNIVGFESTYINALSFSVIGNTTDIMLKDLKIKADCDSDDFKYGIVSDVEFDSDNNITIIILTSQSDALTSNLSEVWCEVDMEDDQVIGMWKGLDIEPLNNLPKVRSEIQLKDGKDGITYGITYGIIYSSNTLAETYLGRVA